MADKFLIAPFASGLENDVKPWLLPLDAFKQLNNAYIFRGRVKKRFGALGIGGIFGLDPELSRLRIKVDTTDANGDSSLAVPGAAANIGAIGQMFSIGDEFFTVYNPAAGAQDMLTTSTTATVFTFNITTSTYDIQDSLALTDVYYYPALPVMGFADFESAEVNNEPTYAFDTRFAYAIINDAWERLDGATAPGDAQWSGTDSDFFWSTTYRGVTADERLLFATNYVRADQMRYFDGTNWTSFNPAFLLAAGNTIESCRIIIKFKGRLLLLNTLEQVGGVNTKIFVNRCRFSGPEENPISGTAFIERNDGAGGFIDCPTKEAIISAYEFKDRLIVFFERSTWELVDTRNPERPFEFREINIEQGAESTFSIVPFDTAILGIGQDGIYACNGYNVERIDSKIPDEVFKFHNDDDGPARVHGIRDFRAEMVYWTVPSKSGSSKYPSRILAYNYKSNSWAFFDDSITAFGYYFYTKDRTWDEMEVSWEDLGTSWDSYVFEESYRTPIAGNQQGYTFIIVPDVSFNANSLQITNISQSAGVVSITCVNHNLESGDWILMTQVPGIPELELESFKVKKFDDNEFFIDEPPTFSGTYQGGGSIILLSKIDIKTKRFNFYTDHGKQSSLEKIDFLVDKIDDSEITVDCLPSSSGISLRDDGLATGALLGTSVLEFSPFALKPMEAAQKRFWHAVYTQAQGESIQIRLYWTDEQMKDIRISTEGFDMHAMLFHASPIEDY